MKLYATTTSERGKPAGKGGNKSLDILIKAQELDGIPTRQDLFKISLGIEGNRLRAKLWDYTEGDEVLLYPRHCSTPPSEYNPRWCKNHLHDNNIVSCVC